MNSTGTEQRAAARALWVRVTAVGCAVLSLPVSWGGLLLVVGERVVPGWVLACVLLLPLPALRWFPVPAATGGPHKHRVVPRWVLAVSATVATSVLAYCALGDWATEADYRVLEPSGPGGCRVVVRETSFLVIGTGEVYEVGTGGLGLQIGSWTADDGHRPFRSGTYELEWGREGGLLRIGGTSTDPVWTSDIPVITCD